VEVYAVMADIDVRVLSKVCLEPNNSGNVRHLSKSIASRVGGEPSNYTAVLDMSNWAGELSKKQDPPYTQYLHPPRSQWQALLSAA
jgi:hypothetical protein